MGNIKQIILLLACLLIPVTAMSAALDRILSDQEATQANNAALAAEANIFKSIGLGIALSLARCEGQNDCTPNVSNAELDEIIDVLDGRISGLATRHEQGEEGLTDILTVYVEQHEKFVRYQDRLKDLSPEIGVGTAVTEDDIEEDAFLEGMATDKKTEGAGVDFSIFEDADESIQDLEDIGAPIEDDIGDTEGESLPEEIQ